MTMTIDQFIQTYNGSTVDVDGFYGGQCWDLWSRYAQDVAGVPHRRPTPSTGTPAASTPAHGTSSPHCATSSTGSPPAPRRAKGDVAFWGNAPATPYTHVAIVIADQGGSLLCLTQNPGATHQAIITKNGLLGYLRPKTAAPAAPSGIAGAWRVNVAKLNVRAQPSTGAQIVAQYSAGQTVNLDGWTGRADGFTTGAATSEPPADNTATALGPAGTTDYLTR